MHHDSRLHGQLGAEKADAHRLVNVYYNRKVHPRVINLY